MDLSYLSRFPCGIARLFGWEPSACRVDASAMRGLSSEGRAATSFYDGLIEDPDRILSFPCRVKDSAGNLTNNIVTKRFTVGGLMDLSPTWRDSTARLQQVLSRFDEYTVNGLLSAQDQQTMLTGVWVGREGNQTRFEKLANPTGILDIPNAQSGSSWVDPYNPTDRRLVPSWFPKHNSSCPVVSFTPRILDQRAVPTAKLQQDYQDLVLALFNFLRDRNVPMPLCPEIIGARQNFQLGRAVYSSYDNNSGGLRVQDWYHDNRNVNYLIQNNVFGYRFPDGDPNQGPQFGGEYSNIWRTSLDRRVPITVGTDSHITKGAWGDMDNALSWEVFTADGVLELLRLVNAAKILLTVSNAGVDARATMVPLFAAQAVYTGAQVRAYQHIGRPYGSNVLGYRANIAKEVQLRKARERDSTVGVPGYHSSGDDAADIGMGLIGCVSGAVGAALASGNPIVGVVAFVVLGLRLMVSFLLEPDAPADPYSLPLRMTEGKGIQFFGLSVTNALELPPAYRVNGR